MSLKRKFQETGRVSGPTGTNITLLDAKRPQLESKANSNSTNDRKLVPLDPSTRLASIDSSIANEEN
ncbi:hypothetical protein K3495_g8909 [Podosphaera aphanis]|nr:hypothetical protein K3495_g8909 [Podosphaera aphanis]